MSVKQLLARLRVARRRFVRKPQSVPVDSDEDLVELAVVAGYAAGIRATGSSAELPVVDDDEHRARNSLVLWLASGQGDPFA